MGNGSKKVKNKKVTAAKTSTRSVKGATKGVKVTKIVPKTTKKGTKAVKKGAKVTKIVPEAKRSSKKGTNRLKDAKKRSLKAVFAEKKTVLTSAVVALVLLVSGLGIGISCAQNAHQETPPEEISQEEPAEPEPEEPAEPELPTVNTDPLVKEPNNVDAATYEVAPYKPRYLSIPSLAAADPAIMNIPVIEVGMWAGNQLGSPTSTRLVGWYYRSAIPGQAGASVMDAHGGALGTGIFKVLPQIKMGAEIIIEMGDGRKVTYIVEEITYKKIGTEADRYMDVAYLPLNGKPTLALITCTGTWLRAQQTYDLRMFVRATLKQ